MSDFLRKSIGQGMSFIAAHIEKSDYYSKIYSKIENCICKMNPIRYIDGNNLYRNQMLFDLLKEYYRFENQAFIPKIEKRLRNIIWR